MLKTYNVVHAHSDGMTFYKFATERDDIHSLVDGGGSSCEDGIPPLLQVILDALGIDFEPARGEGLTIEEDFVAIFIP